MPAGVGFFHIEFFTERGALFRRRGGGVDLARQRFGIGNAEQGKEREQGRVRYGHRRRYPGLIRIQEHCQRALHFGYDGGISDFGIPSHRLIPGTVPAHIAQFHGITAKHHEVIINGPAGVDDFPMQMLLGM